MLPEKALSLKPYKSNVFVNYKGTPGHGSVKGRGVVTHVGPTVCTTYQGREYVWVTIRLSDGHPVTVASHYLS